MTVFFFKHKTAYEMRISDWSSDVCSSDLKSVVAAEESRPDEALPVAAAAAPDTDSPAEVEDPNEDLQPNESLDKDSDYTDRKSVVSGKSESVRVEFSGRRICKKKKNVINVQVGSG